MNNWQKVLWDDEGYVIAPPMLADTWALKSHLVRFVNLDNSVNLYVTSRNRLDGEETYYKAIYVAEIIYPPFDDSDHG
jgi:hypothetical protein